MNRRTKALAIPAKVKKAVLDRDGVCVWCCRPGAPNAHYISRAQGGLGIEENILTLCTECHRRYDQTTDRPIMREFFRKYLQSRYPDWDEDKLIYRK